MVAFSGSSLGCLLAYKRVALNACSYHFLHVKHGTCVLSWIGRQNIGSQSVTVSVSQTAS